MKEETFEPNNSHNNTMKWIQNHVEQLKLSNESNSVDDIVSEMDSEIVVGPIGITREMLEGK